MDDIKLSAMIKQDIDSLIHTTRINSINIGMSFGLKKYGWMVTKRGKLVQAEGISLPEGRIADVEWLQIQMHTTSTQQPRKGYIEADTAKYF